MVTSRQWKIDLEGRVRIGRIPSDIPKELLHHYIRGYFDGDGSIYFDRGRRCISFVFGNEEFAVDFRDHLLPIIEDTKGTQIRKKVNSDRCWYFRVAKQRSVSKLGIWMYKDATIYLPRKRERFSLLGEVV